MQHGDKSFGQFFPTDEYSTKAIHPAVSTLRHPTTRLEAGLLLDGLGFFASGTDMGGKSELFDDVTHFVEVVTLVQAVP